MPIHNFIIASNKAANTRQLIVLWRHAMKSLGFDRLLFTLITEHASIGRRPGHIAVLNYPMAWLAQYSANHYEEIDAVYHHMFVSIGAFAWDSLCSLKKLTPVQTALLNTSVQAGLNNGVAIPLRGPSGELAGVMAARSNPGPSWSAETLDYADLLTKQFYKVFLRLERKAETAGVPQLTDRERQVLALCAAGRSQAEIASAIGVTTHGVKFHMKGILGKFGASSQEVAVMKAVSMGLLSRKYTQEK